MSGWVEFDLRNSFEAWMRPEVFVGRRKSETESGSSRLNVELNVEFPQVAEGRICVNSGMKFNEYINYDHITHVSHTRCHASVGVIKKHCERRLTKYHPSIRFCASPPVFRSHPRNLSEMKALRP